MWNRLTCVDAGADAVALDLAKAQLRVDFDEHDDLIAQAVKSAQAIIHGPKGIGVALVDSEWRLSLDCFPSRIRLELGPVTAITEITYVASDGSTQTLAAGTGYLADLDQSPAVIVPAYQTCFPATRPQPGAVKVTFRAGPAEPDPSLVQAILLSVTDWYSQPGAEGGKALVALPQRARDLLARFGPGSIG